MAKEKTHFLVKVCSKGSLLHKDDSSNVHLHASSYYIVSFSNQRSPFLK